MFILAGVQNSWALRDTVNAEKFIKDATMAKANEAYQQERYKDAIDLYSSIYRTERVSAALYYNLGNSYYRTGNIAKAIVNYERAYLLDPSDADIKFNLDLARSKTVDKITPQSEMFFVTWTKALILSTSVKGWATTAIVSFSLALLLVWYSSSTTSSCTERLLSFQESSFLCFSSWQIFSHTFSRTI